MPFCAISFHYYIIFQYYYSEHKYPILDMTSRFVSYNSFFFVCCFLRKHMLHLITFFLNNSIFILKIVEMLCVSWEFFFHFLSIFWSRFQCEMEEKKNTLQSVMDGRVLMECLREKKWMSKKWNDVAKINGTRVQQQHNIN